MKISNYSSPSVQGKETDSAKKTKSADGKSVEKSSASPVESAKAKVNSSVKSEVSEKAKEMASARAAATSAPDVREDKIAELKRRINEGRYKVDPEAIADKMLTESMELPGA